MLGLSSKQNASLMDIVDTTATLELQRSSLLRMQVTEMLEECQLNWESRKWNSATQEFIQAISNVVSTVSFSAKNIQEWGDKPISMDFKQSSTQKLTIEPIGCTRTKLGWTKPSGNAQCLPCFEILVKVPASFYSAKDYLNYRYFDKRNVIQKHILKALASENGKMMGQPELVWVNGSNRPPIIRLSPPTKKGPKFHVHLHVGLESHTWIPRIRLLPNRKNIKGDCAKAQFYNHCLLYDARHEFEDPHIQGLSEYVNCQETIVLFKVWALQRGLWRNHDGWTQEDVALLLVYLMRTHKGNLRMTAIQLFTLLLQTLASTNWLGVQEEMKRDIHGAAGQDFPARVQQGGDRTIFVLPIQGLTEAETAQQSSLYKVYEKQTAESPLSGDDPTTLLDAYIQTDRYLLGPVFMDPTLTYNYLGCVSPNFMKLMTWHARKSLEDLQRPRSAFDILFMQHARFWQQWDLYFQVPLNSSKQNNDWEFTARAILKNLELGLGNRIYAMRVLSTGNAPLSSLDSDAFFKETHEENNWATKDWLRSPLGQNNMIVGVSINPETSQRVVDRGPPPEDEVGVERFMGLWGCKAQLRRFKDGAILHSVVWDEDSKILFSNQDKWQGGHVEKIIRHILVTNHATNNISFCFPSFLSTIDSIANSEQSVPEQDPFVAHVNALKAFDSFAEFLRKGSTVENSTGFRACNLGLPVAIDAVEPICPTLRYSELFPAQPHTLLGGKLAVNKKVSGALVSPPLVVQIRFGKTSKWPTDIQAIGAAKAAMLIQLAKGVQAVGDDNFDGLVQVSPTYADIGYKGYCFRIIVRADPEIEMLRRLERPSIEAKELLRDLTRRHITSSQHHSMIHAIHTLHPSAAGVVRLARRWASSHLLSGHLDTDLIELVVASIFSESNILVKPPATVISGFMRFLRVLASHNWSRKPLIVNPHGHILDGDYDDIHREFERCRELDKDGGPPMFVVAPYNKTKSEVENHFIDEGSTPACSGDWKPTIRSPETVVLSRIVSLARKSSDYLQDCLSAFGDDDWPAVFRESPGAFNSYSILLRVADDFVLDRETSSSEGNVSITMSEDGKKLSSYSRSLKAFISGPKSLRQKVYRNLAAQNAESAVIQDWQPIQELVRRLERNLGKSAVFFFNEFSPEVIGVLWRPQIFAPLPFSAFATENGCPAHRVWNVDSLVSRNICDIVREVSRLAKNIVVNVRIFDDSCLLHIPKKPKTEWCSWHVA